MYVVFYFYPATCSPKSRGSGLLPQPSAIPTLAQHPSTQPKNPAAIVGFPPFRQKKKHRGETRGKEHSVRPAPGSTPRTRPHTPPPSPPRAASRPSWRLEMYPPGGKPTWVRRLVWQRWEANYISLVLCFVFPCLSICSFHSLFYFYSILSPSGHREQAKGALQKNGISELEN